MTIFVGSTNPVKINAVRQAAQDKWPEVNVIGYATQSGISEQPLSDEETKRGATNRAQAAMAQGLAELKTAATSGPVLAIGLEGGVFTNAADEMWSTVWAVLVDQDGKVYESNGARVKINPVVANAIRQGEELGPLMEKLIGEQDVRQKQGMYGVITNNLVTRTEAYTAIAKFALGLWYGKGWDSALDLTK